ncbi:MAG: hypothetical protein AAB524_01410 [Patescibacteria group bacterium]
MPPQPPENPRGSQAPARPRPHLLSTEGFLMLAFAVLIDIVNILLGFLDFIFIGLILSPIWNFIALCTVGAWLWIQTGQDIKRTKRKQNLLLKLSKRVALPFIGNSVPIAKFFPFWVWSVWGALDKGSSSQDEEEATQEEEMPAQGQGQTAPAPA